MNNACDSHDRSGVLYGSSSDVIYIDNCLTYGNDATYAGTKMSYGANAYNSASINSNPVTPDGLELVAEETEQALIRNMIRNTIFFDAVPFDNAQTIGSRFNDPNCYENVLTNLALEDYTFAGADGPVVFPAKEEQIKVVADLADVELPAGFIKTAGMPELKSFHDAVFSGDATAAGAAGHAASCSCGLADSNVAPHNFVCDVETPEWDSYYCSVCDYVCEHTNGVDEEFKPDCVTAEGYTFDCPDCTYHEEYFEEIAGHNFTFNDAEKGADCKTAGTIAYNYCDVCEKNYAADADVLAPFDTAIDSIEGELGDCVAAEGYQKDDSNHWTVCATCGETIATEAHNGVATDNGDGTHSVVCDVCGYSSDSAAHSFVSDVEVPEWGSYYCSVCDYVCEHTNGVSEEFKPDCVTAEGYKFDCPDCTYHEEYFEEIAGHNFTDVEEIGAVDCQTTGVAAHKYCETCGLNYATDAALDEAFANALTDEDLELPALDHSYSNACDVDCNECGDIREVGDHVYDNAADTDCNECGEIRALEWIIVVDKTGVYEIAPNASYTASFNQATDIVVTLNGDVVKFNTTKNGYPLVAKTEYVITFAKEDSINNVEGELDWNAEKTEGTTFADVPAGEWYNDAVTYSVGAGIITGYGGTNNFGSVDKISRHDFVVILSRIAGVDLSAYDDAEIPFKDVPDNQYYTNAILWAADCGITSGYTSGANAGKFGVGDKVTREQLVTFLYRYAAYINGAAPEVSDGAAEYAASYPDYKSVSDYAKNAVIWALDKGVISGQGGTHIAPAGNALRCEVAKIIYNTYLNGTFEVVITSSANTDVFAPNDVATNYEINFVRNSDYVEDDAYVYTWTPEFDGVLTLSGVNDDVWVVVENADDWFDGVTLDPYNDVTFNAKAGATYIITVMTWSEVDGVVEFTATYTEGVALQGDGSEFDPYVVTDLEVLPAIEAGETVYFMVNVPSVMSTYNLTIMGGRMANFDVNVNTGMYTGTAMGGSVIFENVTPNRRGAIMFGITNTGLMPLEVMYTLEEVALPSVGTESAPDTLVFDTISTANANNVYYYTYTADAAGTLSISMYDNLCANGWVCSIMGGAAEAVYQESADEAHVNPVTYAVEAGETVTIWFATSDFSAGEVYFMATIA